MGLDWFLAEPKDHFQLESPFGPLLDLMLMGRACHLPSNSLSKPRQIRCQESGGETASEAAPAPSAAPGGVSLRCRASWTLVSFCSLSQPECQSKGLGMQWASNALHSSKYFKKYY